MKKYLVLLLVLIGSFCLIKPAVETQAQLSVCTPTTTVTEGDLFPGGLVSFAVTPGAGSVTVDHVNSGTGLQSLTVVGVPTNAIVTIPAFSPGTTAPVTVTFTVINPNLPVDFVLRAASTFNAVFIRVRCGDTDGDGVPDSRDNCPTTPNPEKIAFTSTRDGNSEIYVMNADGTNQTRLTTNTAGDIEPSWGAQADSDGDGIGDACYNHPPVAQCRNVTVTLAAGQMTAPALSVLVISGLLVTVKSLSSGNESANGQGKLVNEDGSRSQFSFNVKRNPNGKVTGQASFRNPSYKTNNGQNEQIKIEVTCLKVV